MTLETLRMIPRNCATARREPLIIAITQVESHLILAMSNKTIPAPKDPFQIFRHTDQYKIKSSQDFEGWFILRPPSKVIYIPMYVYIYIYIYIYILIYIYIFIFTPHFCGSPGCTKVLTCFDPCHPGPFGTRSAAEARGAGVGI